MQLTIRYFAAARAAAGRDENVVTIDESSTLGELELVLAHGNPALAQVLERSSYLRDEIAVRDRSAPLGPCRILDVLPPFAGG
ncbi:MoaD/ThiS family protein [Gordonia soli]|uniref:Molybdopterin synthase sulfur carrier subunit n=1 Tax=Gordonia soli NBRC 108243 TaxID=1223545 RepID=M0QI88_9ACTN|nr:MoaD/ThiS family protein [Gordonia soli]GAC68330.1 molybdopterin synthase sulfur carrier subunit [Gordonia soli NBRC 108243]